MTFIDRSHTQPLTEFGHTLRELRVRRELSLRALTDLTGINAANLSRLENGPHVPRQSTIELLTDVLADRKFELWHAYWRDRYQALKRELRDVERQLERYE